MRWGLKKIGIFVLVIYGTVCMDTTSNSSVLIDKEESHVIKIYRNSDKVLEDFINTNDTGRKIKFTDQILEADLAYNFSYGGFGGGCDPGACLPHGLRVEALKGKDAINVQYAIKTSHVRRQYPGDLGGVEDESVSELLSIRNELYFTQWVSVDPVSKFSICNIYDGFKYQSKKNLIDYCFHLHVDGILFELN